MQHHRIDMLPVIVPTAVLPVEFYLPSEPVLARGKARRVYLEMRDSDGRTFIVEPERTHMEGIYVAHCIFDRYGTWYLTWHGLRDKPSEPVQVDIEHPLLYTHSEVC